MNWYKSTLFDTITPENASDILDRLVFGDKYHSIKSSTSKKRHITATAAVSSKDKTFILNEIMYWLQDLKDEGMTMGVNQFAREIGITPYLLKSVIKSNKDIVEKKFPNIFSTLLTNRVPDKTKNRIVEIHQNAINNGKPSGSGTILRQLLSEGFPRMAQQSILRILNENGLSAKNQKRDVLLSHFLNKLRTIGGHKGFTNTFAKMDEMQRLNFLTNFIDKNYVSPEKEMLKEEMFSRKTQLRDIVLNQIEKKSPLTNSRNIYTHPGIAPNKKDILKSFKNGFTPAQIAKEFKIPVEYVGKFLNNYKWQNFQMDPRHPSNIITETKSDDIALI
jgi:hypothetical protein